MKILYGVQGTGNGHISRAREMARCFATRGVHVDFFFTGRSREALFDMACFGDFQVGTGLTFVTEKGQIRPLKTAFKNNLLLLHREIKELDLSDYDVVLNDFEPVSAWAAKQQGVTTIGVSHQNAFLKQVPITGRTLFDRLLMRWFAPTQHQLGLHWYHFEQGILPPITPQSNPADIAVGERYLVYLPFEQLPAIIELLGHFEDCQFDVYHPDISARQRRGHIHLHPLSRQHFHHDLHRCAGVIANGGFELPSEAIGMGKKLLLKPLKGQFEQQSNVMTLEMMGLAKAMHTLHPLILRDWLEASAAGVVHYPDVAQVIVDWILAGKWHCQRDMHERLWAETQFPELVDDCLNDFDQWPLRGRRVSMTSL